MAEKLNVLYNHLDQVAQMQQNAFEHVRDFTLGRVAQKTLAVYKQLAAAGC